MVGNVTLIQLALKTVVMSVILIPLVLKIVALQKALKTQITTRVHQAPVILRLSAQTAVQIR